MDYLCKMTMRKQLMMLSPLLISSVFLFELCSLTTHSAWYATQTIFFAGGVQTQLPIPRSTFYRGAPWEKGYYGSVDRIVNIGSHAIVSRI